MKAVTVQQPWAWAIVHGGKDVENRTQAWSYRGPLAIHAGKRLSERGCNVIPSIIDAEAVPGVMDAYTRAELVYGAIIGTVELVEVHPAHEGCCESWWGEQGPRHHHLVLADPRPLEPIPCRGALGLWTPPAELRL